MAAWKVQMAHQGRCDINPTSASTASMKAPAASINSPLDFHDGNAPTIKKHRLGCYLVTNTANTIGSPAILFGGSLLTGFVQQFGTHFHEFSLKTTFINPRSKS
jgi:hypothetical protein